MNFIEETKPIPTKAKDGEGASDVCEPTIVDAPNQEEAACDVKIARRKASRLSGAQRRKLRKAAGTWLPPTKSRGPSQIQEAAGAGPSTGRKRPIMHQTGSERQEKRPRNVEISRSTRSAPTWYRIAVVSKDHPGTILNSEQVDLIQNRLVAALDDSIAASEGEAEVLPLQFHSAKFVEDILWITCANLQSKNWLTEIVPKLAGLWEGAALMATSSTELLKRYRVLVWIPNTGDEATIRTRLAKQNPDLCTKSWSLLSSKMQDTGQSLVYYIDKKSLDVLERAQFKAFWCLSKVTFKTI